MDPQHNSCSLTHRDAAADMEEEWPSADLSALEITACEIGSAAGALGEGNNIPVAYEIEQGPYFTMGVDVDSSVQPDVSALLSSNVAVPDTAEDGITFPQGQVTEPQVGFEDDPALEGLGDIMCELPQGKKKTVSIASPDTYTTFHLPVAYYEESEDDDEVFQPEVVDDIDQPPIISMMTSPTSEGRTRRDATRNLSFPPRFHSESDESYYDTVSSTSSTAALLRRAVVDIKTGKLERVPPAPSQPNHAPQITGSLDLNAASSGSSGLLSVMQLGSGKALLHKTLEQVKRSLEDLSPTLFPQAEGMPSPQDSANKLKSSYLKNLVVLSFGFMMTYTAFFSMRNLQSSIHHEGGLGLVSMACLYSSFVVGCFFATTIIHQIRPQRAIVLSTCGNLIFILVNLHPTFYTMIPATLFLGFAMAVMWTAQGTYITSIGVSYAAISGQKPETVLGLFNGFFLFLLQMAQILGNLVSSTVLNIELEYSGKFTAVETNINYTRNMSFVAPDAHLSNGTDLAVLETGLTFKAMNSSVCGAAYCHSYKIDHGSFNLEDYMLHTLIGIYAGLAALATVFMATFLDKLDVIFHKAKHGVRKQLLAVCSVHKERNMLLMIAFMIFVGMHEAFIYGEVTKAFITCPLGVHMIGYAMMCFGACDSVAAFVCGQLHRYISRPVFVTFGAVLDIGLLISLHLWQPSANQTVVIFVSVGGLGICDAIWQTQSCNLCGLLFPSKHREAAFASLRMYESLGFTIAFSTSQFICMDLKILTIAVLLLVAMFNYSVLEAANKKKDNKQPPLFV